MVKDRYIEYSRMFSNEQLITYLARIKLTIYYRKSKVVALNYAIGYVFRCAEKGLFLARF